MTRNIPERKKPILDHYVKASMAQANGRHDHSGRYATLTWDLGTGNYSHAIQMRNALYRSARHLDVHLDLELDQLSNGHYQITYAAVHKNYVNDYWHPLEVWKRQRREEKQ